MPARTSIVLTGDKEFIAALDRVTSPKVRGRALKVAGLLLAKIAAEDEIIRGGRFGPSKSKLTDAPVHPIRLTSRSGRLRASLASSRAVDPSGLPRYIDVGTNVKYAPAHELGLKDTVSVPSHDVRQHTRTGAFGKKTKSYTVPAHKRKAHQRKMNLKARPFLKPAGEKVRRKLPTIFRLEMERELARAQR